MRLFGGALLALAGLLAGLTAAESQRQKERRCRSLIRMLALMEFELARFRTPLPELFTALGERLEEPAGFFCRALGAGLRAGQPFPALWARAAAEIGGPEGESLAPLGRVLGRYGAEEQTAALASCRGELEEYGELLRRLARERSRLYIGVGAAGGVMLAVLLL